MGETRPWRSGLQALRWKPGPVRVLSRRWSSIAAIRCPRVLPSCFRTEWSQDTFSPQSPLSPCATFPRKMVRGAHEESPNWGTVCLRHSNPSRKCVYSSLRTALHPTTLCGHVFQVLMEAQRHVQMKLSFHMPYFPHPCPTLAKEVSFT
ncbi:Ankyrin Repeat And Sterile Alpha Motif Domain-Containing Protein 1B [Manis pentadactyla]|nr:Ankyrin Repeat And Sterile Alpha Motif Domain-Containing Protein 1B [Manis pentadactyla]